jgi:uncharacterized protein (TIGR02246 family)
MQAGERDVRELYRRLLTAWNTQDANEFGVLFAETGELIGFDGSQATGSHEITEHLRPIFADHRTPRYVGLVRSVRMVGDGVAVLRAEAGMLPPDEADINPALSSVQSLLAVHHPHGWEVALFHNTPAHFHGRPHEVDSLTADLRAAAAAAASSGAPPFPL